MKSIVQVLCLLFAQVSLSQGIVLPSEFEDVTVITGMRDPSTISFAPDGRLFYSERITGALRVAQFDAMSETWNVLPDPFYTFDVPATRHRSSGLRGIAFDPDFVSNGYVYAFYMKDNPRHNRVVRIQADPGSPNVALPGETVILEVPFNNSSSSGSHNGGDLVFGADGKLYFTTGDGWNGGDNVQSLQTYTGKLFRMNPDGTIPTDNPFYNTATGDFRAIYAIGLRNPYTVSCVSASGNIYINDAVGSDKATVLQIRSDGTSAGANFGHDGYGGIGNSTAPWANTAVDGAILITGGAWYPQSGYWPEEYRGSYFAAMWGSNSGNPGHIVRVQSETNTSVSTFASGILIPPRHKPVMTEIGPDGNIYYLMTDYETGDGEAHMIRYTGQAVTGAPVFSPPPGQYDDPVEIEMSSTTVGTDIYYTDDGTSPDSTSLPYAGAIAINASIELKAIAYADSALPSAISVGEYIIGPVPNIAPVADAGPDLIVELGETITLNGSGSMDPDGSALEIVEDWKQVDGPPAALLDADETVANFTPEMTGTYVFRITVEDIEGAVDSAEAQVTVVNAIPDVLDGLIARWSCESGQGTLLEDTSPNGNRGLIQGASWSEGSGDGSDHSISFNGSADRVDIGNLDISGDEMAICFWTKIRSYATSDARFISKANGQNDSDHRWMVSTLNNDQLRFRLNTDAGGTKTLISASGVLPLDEWMHIAAVYDGTAMRLYKNGAMIASDSKSGNIGTDPSMDAALCNQPASASGGSRPFDGWIDEVRIYGRSLSTDEIDTIMNATVQKCTGRITNLDDNGNGSLRRCIDCARSGDTLHFDALPDSIVLYSAPVHINNSLSIKGNASRLPRIFNGLAEAGIRIRSGITVHMDQLDLGTATGPLILNNGTLSFGSVHLFTPESSVEPVIENIGEARILGELLVRRE